ncbi:sulfurtransferase [Priestia taiwanensis]|uniref:Thiosulfate sulfurtransferase n=1 Tax=Priestia taiwanensis TaxID=1347902 RepID=A0A917EMK9_9BACI|nr:sulfurtransferase [Priestia taiwanensis]MBM7361758.1 thiosulfate/3-mercaptopyruvate sulfurtransferase [Priestia taiwanensis]GGE56750.1 thiosulfate sulfurtransferase [Priestia taiwanensis]
MKHLVEVEWLHEHLQDVRVIDCRFDMSNKVRGKVQYEQDHIPSAVYMDLNHDLSSEVKEHGGRHPLPSIEMFIQLLSSYGIDKKTTVVAYDDQAGANASRLWWLLTYIGHEKVYVLNGGFSAWKQAHYETTNEIPMFEKKVYTASIQHHLLVNMEEVRERIESGAEGYILVDSREPIRYVGKEEPIDKVAGHIPTATNLFWKSNIDENGKWKSTEELQVNMAHLQGENEVIVYCGSGVTACPNIIAMSEVGLRNVKLYAGSFSDWISYEENEITKKAD